LIKETETSLREAYGYGPYFNDLKSKLLELVDPLDERDKLQA